MAVISEDEERRTGFWCGSVYEFLTPTEGSETVEMATRDGGLLIKGALGVGYVRLEELRKAAGGGTIQHPRLSIERDADDTADAVVTPLVRSADGLWCDDPTRRAFITPAVRLGGKADAAEEEEAASSAAAAAMCTAGVVYDINTVPVAGCGGRPLRPMDLDGSETGPKAMKVTPAVSLDAMKLNQLKAELAARGARQAGLKAVLQRRLHGLLMTDAVTRAAERAAKRPSRQDKHKSMKRLHAEIFGSDDDEAPGYKSADSWDEE